MDTVDWRAQLQPGTRQRNVNEIMNKLNRDHRHFDEDEFSEVWKIAQNIEHKTYAGATSQVDYSEKISFLLLSIDRSGWGAQLQPDSRQRIVHKITDTLIRHLPDSGQEGRVELHRIAERFEQKIYNAATSQADYLRQISVKMLTMEDRSQNTMANSMPLYLGGSVTNQRAEMLGGQVAQLEGERNAAVRQSARKRRQPQWLAEFVTNG